jgi:hypothetical protein
LVDLTSLGNLGSFLAGLAAIWVVVNSQKPAIGLEKRPHVYRRNDGFLSLFLPMNNFGNAAAQSVLLRVTIFFGDQRESVEYSVASEWFPNVPLNWDLAGAAIPAAKPFYVKLEIQWRRCRFPLCKAKSESILHWGGDLNDMNLYLENRVKPSR